VNVTILLFNNRIYGLTKGQYSPTSEVGKKTKSTPLGSLDHPFQPLSVALGAEASFVARSIDVEPNHLVETLKRVAAHKGSAFRRRGRSRPRRRSGSHDVPPHRPRPRPRTVFAASRTRPHRRERLGMTLRAAVCT
jgi:2-oxoglutarate ferredoxin oxidoreductase subunit beta